ncbi:uncharacterized protein LOC125217823 isoform X7 [Salvia hispanica]|uniref:uncharacterized protein LOC125217823 isoform X7 n=1 Tax=Salvia hispanica TaxID=49212 RepID=UPI002009A21A|nr:uncharacterized protein LOC125217823 isoform X7 [Salvia hispanica]
MRRLLLNFFKVVFVVSILAQEPLPLSGQVPTQDKRRHIACRNWNCLKPYMASSFRKHNELKRCKKGLIILQGCMVQFLHKIYLV